MWRFGPSTLTPSSGGRLPAASGNRTWISQTQTGRADHYTTHTYVTLDKLYSIILPELSRYFEMSLPAACKSSKYSISSRLSITHQNDLFERAVIRSGPLFVEPLLQISRKTFKSLFIQCFAHVTCISSTFCPTPLLGALAGFPSFSTSIISPGCITHAIVSVHICVRHVLSVQASTSLMAF